MAKPTHVLSGSVPGSSAAVRDRYYATDTGDHYVWNGSSMVNLGFFNDESSAALAAEQACAQTGEVTAVKVASGDGAIAIPVGREAIVAITKGSAAVLTLAAPAAGDDGKRLTVVSETAFAHVVTTPANKIQDGTTTTKDTATFAAHPGASIVLMARNQLWNLVALNAVVLTEV